MKAIIGLVLLAGFAGHANAFQDAAGTPPVVTEAGALQPITPESDPFGLGAAKLRADTAQKDYDRAKQMVQAGVATPEVADHALADAQDTKEAYRRLLSAAAYHERADLLARPVDVKLTKADLKQATAVLSRTVGIPITLSAQVPESTRISMEARHVALSSVLEAIARQANLIIAPGDNNGIALEPWPSLTVDGTPQTKTFQYTPWSTEWKPDSDPFAGGPPVPSVDYDGGWSQSGVSSPISVTTVRDRLVLAEAGIDDKGRAGTWLTVYRLDGDTLKATSSTFHPTAGMERGHKGADWSRNTFTYRPGTMSFSPSKSKSFGGQKPDDPTTAPPNPGR